jgi:hypothetical protein
MFYSYLRLGTACLLVFGGLAVLLQPEVGARITGVGVVLGGVGLAVALQETALLGARYIREGATASIADAGVGAPLPPKGRAGA